SEVDIRVTKTAEVGGLIVPQNVEFIYRFRFKDQDKLLPVVHRRISVTNYFQTRSLSPLFEGSTNQVAVFDYRFKRETGGRPISYEITNNVWLQRDDPLLLAMVNRVKASASPQRNLRPMSIQFGILLFV